MKVLTVVGARPQFVKAAAVSRLLRATAGFSEILLHTGQHYDANMSEVFFSELNLPRPEYHLGIGSGSHGAQTGQMLAAIEQALLREKPDIVLLYGDTNSTLAGALAAAKMNIPVAHVEAGLRSHNRRMPEEINRVLTDHVSELLFVPTVSAAQNLVHEGIPRERIHQVGDVMYDAALYYAEKSRIASRLLGTLGLQPKSYALATIHRAENTDDPARLRSIIEGLRELSGELAVVLPLHPRTRKICEREGSLKDLPSSFQVIEPVSFLDMIQLECNAAVIATDSGGVQKEAFFYRVPCVTLRDETEWVELVELGWNRLLPPASGKSIAAGIRAARGSSGTEATPYGQGKTGEAIIEILKRFHSA